VVKELDSEQILALSEDELIARLKEVAIPSKKEKVISKLQEILAPYVGDEIRRVLIKIQNDKELSTLLK
jgi:hypothetical protein